MELSVVSEEKESKVSQSYYYVEKLDILNFTQDIPHDINLLQTALSMLKKDISLNPDLAIMHYNQIKNKVDEFFELHTYFEDDQDVQRVSLFCNEFNNCYYLLQDIALNSRRKSQHSLENSRFMYKKQSTLNSQNRVYDDCSRGGINTSFNSNLSPRLNQENGSYNAFSYSPHFKREYSNTEFQQNSNNNNNNGMNGHLSINQENNNNMNDSWHMSMSQQIREFSEYIPTNGTQEQLIQTPYCNNKINKGRKSKIQQQQNQMKKIYEEEDEELKENDYHHQNGEFFLEEVQIKKNNHKQKKVMAYYDEEDEIDSNQNNQNDSTKQNSQQQQQQQQNSNKQNHGIKIKISSDENEEIIPNKDDNNNNKNQNNQNIQNNLISTNPTITKSNQEEFEKLMQDITELIKQTKYYYDERIIDKAIDKKDEIYNLRKKKSAELKLRINQKSDLDKLINQSLDLFEDIQTMNDHVLKTTKFLDIQDGWIKEKDKKNIQVTYRYTENSPMITLKVNAQINIDIKALIALVYEVELYTRWMPFCSEGVMLKKIDRSTKAVKLRYGLPIISDREAYLWGAGIDRIHKDGKILIVVRSIDKDKEFQRKHNIKIEPENKIVRADVPFFVFEITPRPEKKYLEMVAIGNFDAKLQFIPDRMVNFVLRKFAYLMVEHMFSYGQEKKFKGSEWEKRIHQNPEFYGWIDEKYKMYFEKQASQNNSKSEISFNSKKKK